MRPPYGEGGLIAKAVKRGQLHFSQFGLTLSAKTEKFKQGPAVDDAGFYSSVREGSRSAFHDLLTVKQNLN
jgi:hypothetical protein